MLTPLDQILAVPTEVPSIWTCKQGVDRLAPQAAGYDQNRGTVHGRVELSLERQRAHLIDDWQNLHLGSPGNDFVGFGRRTLA